MVADALLMVVLRTCAYLPQVPQAPGEKPVPPSPRLISAETRQALPMDSKDHQPLLLGATSREAILAHRAVFRDNMDHLDVPAPWRARWKALDAPCTLVVAFGSWCSDSQAQLPDFLALSKETNPFIAVNFIGVNRDKKAASKDWPKGIEPQAIEKVPTFWLFALQPDGSWKLIGSIMEEPPKPHQRMAEAVLELLEKAP